MSAGSSDTKTKFVINIGMLRMQTLFIPSNWKWTDPEYNTVDIAGIMDSYHEVPVLEIIGGSTQTTGLIQNSEGSWLVFCMGEVW